MSHEIIMAGFGGQGIMSMGMMLAYAGMIEGKHVSWIPSYGPEQRGGTANCSVVVSDSPIASPVVIEPSECIVMNLPSLHKFEPRVKPGGVLLINDSLVKQEVERDDLKVVRLAVNEEANDLGNARVANMVMLGALVQLTGMVKIETIRQCLKKVLPERRHNLIPLNEQALERGKELVRKL